MLQAVKALFAGFLRLLDIFVGVPSLLAHNLENKIREERSRYLVAELVCRVRNFNKLKESIDGGKRCPSAPAQLMMDSNF